MRRPSACGSNASGEHSSCVSCMMLGMRPSTCGTSTSTSSWRSPAARGPERHRRGHAPGHHAAGDSRTHQRACARTFHDPLFVRTRAGLRLYAARHRAADRVREVLEPPSCWSPGPRFDPAPPRSAPSPSAPLTTATGQWRCSGSSRADRGSAGRQRARVTVQPASLEAALAVIPTSRGPRVETPARGVTLLLHEEFGLWRAAATRC